jgi:hypothetical protein
MTLAAFATQLLVTGLVAAIAAGCAGTIPPAPVPAAPVPVAHVITPPPADEWNVFPDPLTGHVDVYHNGEDIGSITGDEKEDPPLPKPHRGDEVDKPE